VKVRIEDAEALSAIRPLDLAAYLRASGWKQLDGDLGPSAAWEIHVDGQAVEVLAPLNQSWRDYGRRVASVLDTLTEVENRSALPIVHDIHAVFFDVIRLRQVGTGTNWTVSLLDGVRLSSTGRSALLAAACSAVSPRRAYHTRKPQKALAYAESLRLDQSERGSYVLPILSHVPMRGPSEQMSLPNMPAGLSDEPYERKVTRIFARALARTISAAARTVSTGAFDAFDDAVDDGVSADLCEALGEMAECPSMTSFEVSISWAPSRPVPREPRPRFTFGTDVLEVVREAGQVLRAKAPIDDFDLVGVVVTVHRPDAQVRGSAVVHAHIDGHYRKVKVDLADEDWQLAEKALRNHLVFGCVGELVRVGKQFRLENPRRVCVYEDDDDSVSAEASDEHDDADKIDGIP
jgi:hypothetical protein